MEFDKPNPSNCSSAGEKANRFTLIAVSPGGHGEGLPYAPEDWPNSGDKWNWRVGTRRVDQHGKYVDRFLYLPKRLQDLSSKRLAFSSKVSVEQYIQKEFPSADIDAFFASFSWKIPSNIQSSTEVKAKKVKEERAKEIKDEKVYFSRKRKLVKKSVSTSNLARRQTRQSFKFISKCAKDTGNIIDISSLSKEDSETSDSQATDLHSTSNDEPVQVSSHRVTSSPSKNGVLICSPGESIADVAPNDFSNYLNSLEVVLNQQLPENPLTPSSKNDSFNLTRVDEYAEARKNLSSILSMDFALLVSPKVLSKLTVLSSKVQEDPNLSEDQLSKLKLIEEIPLVSKDFLEAKGMIEHANKFFVDLEANVAKAFLLRNEYNELKEEEVRLQAEVDSTSLAIKEVDDQIAQLEAKKSELSRLIEVKEQAKAELLSSQMLVAKTLPEVVNGVQRANSRKAEWDLKKDNSVKRVAKIIDKFASLKEFHL